MAPGFLSLGRLAAVDRVAADLHRSELLRPECPLLLSFVANLSGAERSRTSVGLDRVFGLDPVLRFHASGPRDGLTRGEQCFADHLGARLALPLGPRIEGADFVPGEAQRDDL